MSGEVEGAVVANEDDEEGHWPSRDGHGLFESGEQRAESCGFVGQSQEILGMVPYTMHTPM